MAQRRRERFVGRRADLEELERAFRDAAAGAQLVTLIGPAGVGKTAIARRFCDDVQAKGGAVCWIGSEDITANAHDILEALAAQGRESFADLGRGEVPDVLVLDAFERFVPLSRWFFQTQLPEAGTKLLVILTTRERIDHRLRTELALSLDMSERVIGNLPSADATTALARARVAPILHSDIYASSQGHPLLLALFADRYANSDAKSVDRAATSDVLGTLVREILREAPTPAHRDALYALSLGSALDADLLHAVTKDPDWRKTFDWLAERAFVAPVPDGLRPHALVHDALFADLVLAHPVKRAELADRMLDELERRFVAAPLERRLQIFHESAGVRRDVPFVREGLGLEMLRRFHCRRGTDEDADAVEAWTAEFEGPTAAKLFRRWFGLQREGFFVIGDEEPTPAGVFFNLRVGATTAEQRAGDPVMEDAWRVRERMNAESGRPDDEMGVARFFFTRRTYQAFGPTYSAVMFCGPIVFTDDPRALCYIMHYVTEGERWKPYCQPFGMTPLDHTVELDGRVFYPHIRGMPGATPDDPMTHGERQVAAFRSLLATTGIIRATPIVVPDRPAGELLSEADFHKAVRAALPLLHRRHDLKANPLVTSAMLKATLKATLTLKASPDPNDRLTAADALSKLLVEACASLPSAKKILEATFVRPVVKQQAAAAELGLPYGTYRYQLRAATDLLAKELWEREKTAKIGG